MKSSLFASLRLCVFALNSPLILCAILLTSWTYLVSSCVSEQIILRDAATQTLCQNERTERGGPQDDELGKREYDAKMSPMKWSAAGCSLSVTGIICVPEGQHVEKMIRFDSGLTGS